MGNYVSCTLATPLMRNSKAVRVIFPGGEVRQFREAVKAAELMLELPNFFATNSRSLHIGRRFSALSADEELEFGNVYVMYPMRRVNSIVTTADLAVVFMAVNSAAKRISSGKIRILPHSDSSDAARDSVVESNDDRDHSSNSEDDHGHHETRSAIANEFDQIVPEFKFRLAACRSRKPMLETIKEEPIRFR